jgi:hypothetical protein
MGSFAPYDDVLFDGSPKSTIKIESPPTPGRTNGTFMVEVI